MKAVIQYHPCAKLSRIGIWSKMGTSWQPHPTQDQPAPPGGFEIDSRIGAATPRAPAASMEDSRPQAILKFHRLSSLDYRVRHELPVYGWYYDSISFLKSYARSGTINIRTKRCKSEEKISRHQRCNVHLHNDMLHICCDSIRYLCSKKFVWKSPFSILPCLDALMQLGLTLTDFRCNCNFDMNILVNGRLFPNKLRGGPCRFQLQL